QDRVDLDMIKKEESSKLNVTEGKNITEEVNVTTVAPAEQPEEQGTLEELGFSRPEEPFVVEANQNVMLVIGLLIFVGVILLIGFMNYRHAKQEKSDEHKKHPHHEVAGLKFKNLPKHVEEEPEEESEEDNKESEEEKEDEEEKKSEKAKEKDEEEKHKQHPAHHGEEKKVHEKKSEKKEAKSKHSKDDPEDEVEDLNFEELGKELTEAREAHKKRR
ncbi:hypothetical protein J4457_02685, partial [Candidatus Woesearchaeota archaeon]|nr:hypothetical protein [Candidatus Woesearchaeota archaeon]